MTLDDILAKLLLWIIVIAFFGLSLALAALPLLWAIKAVFF
jgi:hypothetical protein